LKVFCNPFVQIRVKTQVQTIGYQQFLWNRTIDKIAGLN